MTEIQGWLEPEVAAAMRDLILEVKPDICVEIGVFAGKSLINSALALKENGKGIIYGIDPWRKEESLAQMGSEETVEFWEGIDLEVKHRSCVHEIWNRGLDNTIIIRARSDQTYQLFAEESIDILYIDGAHSEQASMYDSGMYVWRVKRGGYIWFDDANWQSTQKAIGILQRHCTLEKDFGHSHLYRRS